MEIHETFEFELELINPNGSTRIEKVLFRYKYLSGQVTTSPEIHVNSNDLAKLIETIGAPNFDSIGIKLMVKLTTNDGQEKLGEVDLPENVRKASPAELRAMGDQL